MKKLIAMLVTVLCAVPMIVAQESVSGVVVDKQGNPLPGVRIEVPGSSDWTVSDLDGTFTITPPFGSKKVQATYAGMNSRKVKLKDGMRIKMNDANWWSQKPDKWNWFVNAIVAFPDDPFSDRTINPAYGLMVGFVKNWGFYVKGNTNTFGVKATEVETWTEGLIDKQKYTYRSITGGGIVRLGCPIHLYAGAGYAQYSHYLRGLNSDWYLHGESSHHNFVVDLGLLLRIKRVTVSLGYCFAPRNEEFREDDILPDHRPMGAGNFGIGYTF